MIKKNDGWKKLPIGGLIDEPGTSEAYETGSWRTYKPIHNKEKCTNCLICFNFCPDSAIKLNDMKIDHIDYDHCKGCGICAYECPVKGSAIDMVLDKKGNS